MNIVETIRDLERYGFYGSIEFKFENGKLVLVKKTETSRPTLDTRRNRGDYNDTK